MWKVALGSVGLIFILELVLGAVSVGAVGPQVKLIRRVTVEDEVTLAHARTQTMGMF